MLKNRQVANLKTKNIEKSLNEQIKNLQESNAKLVDDNKKLEESLNNKNIEINKLEEAKKVRVLHVPIVNIKLFVLLTYQILNL